MQEFCLLYRIPHFLVILTGNNECRKPKTKQTLIIHTALVYHLRLKAFFVFLTKGQLISKGLFDFFNCSKKLTKNFCPSRLNRAKIKTFKFIFGRIEDVKIFIQD